MPQYAAFLREVGADQVIDARKIKVFVTRTFPLEQIQEALAFKQEGVRRARSAWSLIKRGCYDGYRSFFMARGVPCLAKPARQDTVSFRW